MRRKRNVERAIAPDLKYDNAVVAKFVNYVMRRGKKTVAEKVVYGAFARVGRESGEDPLVVFQRAVSNASPLLEIRPRRIGGATYQVPREVSPKRRLALAFRWIIAAARARSGKPAAEKLAEEILLAAKNEGSAIKRRHDMHRMAEANKAFAHFAW
ncbi:MAG: 30S ribosomal protein S7 [Candidatus Sungbacteria bacterium RIFCSPLOWO2_01_FULL_59_16]|uniref:Small ribosomal subunit protein uS7 n=1 Tax=Candidatus Sungbacteria bacterium RIFCSPLOWO2_01_FULL_59_16 TaxID=1802280 RepID=A0A1G2LDV4_9BACT|nr:MAG: 30S ribosomal protein S7 [Candidatus Sungbacteria bacterium RIFCSPLOWO2_01_FULL_59_16]